MAGLREPGEDADLYATVRAVAWSCVHLGDHHPGPQGFVVHEHAWQDGAAIIR